MREKISVGEVVFSPDETRIIRKIYLKNLDGRTPETILFGKDVGTTRDAAAELKELFGGEVPFDTAKPVALIRHMLSLAGVASGDCVLDFFAGSGSTAHGVAGANQEDGGHRRFVLVQLPEPTGREDFSTIADITKERVRRVIKKLNDEDAGKLPLEGTKNQDRGFRVFKLAESNFKAWNAEVSHESGALVKQLEMHVEHVRKDRNQADLFFELMLKSGFPLTAPVETLTLADQKIFSVASSALFICLEKNITLETIRAMADKKPERVVCLDEGFAKNDQLKANAVQIFKTKNIIFRTV